MTHPDKCKCFVCQSDAMTLEEAKDAFLKETAKNIAATGRSCIGVMGEKGSFPFTYTIGNALAGKPELLLIGVPNADAMRLLNFMSEKLSERGDAEGPFEIGGKFPMYMLEASEEAKDKYTRQATNYLGGTDQYRLMQLVVPDLDGKYPWDEGCKRPYSDMRVWRKES